MVRPIAIAMAAAENRPLGVLGSDRRRASPASDSRSAGNPGLCAGIPPARPAAVPRQPAERFIARPIRPVQGLSPLVRQAITDPRSARDCLLFRRRRGPVRSARWGFASWPGRFHSVRFARSRYVGDSHRSDYPGPFGLRSIEWMLGRSRRQTYPVAAQRVAYSESNRRPARTAPMSRAFRMWWNPGSCPGTIVLSQPSARQANVGSLSILRQILPIAESRSEPNSSSPAYVLIPSQRKRSPAVDPILDEYCRTRELWGVVAPADCLELSLGVGLTFLDVLGLAVGASVDGLDCAWVSRRRAAIRSAVDCRPVVLRSETLGVDLERKDLADSLAPTDGLAGLELMDGLERLNEGFG